MQLSLHYFRKWKPLNERKLGSHMTVPACVYLQAFEVENFNQAYQKGKHFLPTTFMVNLNQAYLESLVKPGFTRL